MSAPTIAGALAAARHSIPMAEARLLLRHVLGAGAAWLEAHRDDPLLRDAAEAFAALVERRVGGEPVAYLLGFREFYGREFSVTPDVLIPRPETELLVDLVRGKVGRLLAAEGAPRRGGVAAASRMRGAGLRSAVGASASAVASPQAGPLLRAPASPGETITLLDLGTGSGCIAITLAMEIPDARVAAADVSGAALAVARANATLLGADVSFVESDWLSAFAGLRFDVIVSNPPYVAAGDPHLAEGDLRFEPPHALHCGSDGLDAIRRIVAAAPTHLMPGGWLFLEHGYDQAERLSELLAEAGFGDIEQHRDLAGIVRVSGGRRPA